MVQAALVVAMVLVVPIGTELLDRRGPALVLAGGAVGGALALGLPPGPVAGLLAAAWLAAALVLKANALAAWWADPELGWCALGRLAATGYLVAGAGWLVVSRLGLSPLGLEEPYVALTAVHFHYAGFGASLLLAVLAEREDVPTPVAFAVTGGPVVVAAGFAIRPELQLVGAVLLAAGLAGVGVLSWRAGNVAVRLSAVCVLAGMALALHWAGAVVTGAWDPLPIEAMARVHGTLNGFGFVVVGLLGRAAQLSPRPATAPSGLRTPLP